MTAPGRGSGHAAHAGIHFPPPLLFVGGLAAGALAQRGVPIPLLPASWRAVGVLGGWALIVMSLLVSTWAMTAFLRARTPLMPNRPAHRLVMTGPYRLSRNPMYLSLSMLYLGVSLLADIAWSVMLLPVVWILLVTFVIRAEERYLSARFGHEYDAYRARVRRWI